MNDAPLTASAIPPQPRRTPTLSKRKRIAFTFLIALFLALFAELSLHVFYKVSVGRWLWEWWAIPIFEADPIRVYRLKSNLDYLHRTREFTARYRTDAAGMRCLGGDPPPPIQKSKDTFRILAFGPSFAFGWGVNYEDSYMYRIAAGLRVPGKRVELINLGTPSQPVSYQLKWLREAGHAYQPDLIVQTAYFDDLAAIDTDDTLPENRPVIRNGYLSSAEKMTPSLWLKSMRRYSALMFYGWHAYHAVTRGNDVSAGDGREFYRPSAEATNRSGEECLQRYRRYLQFIEENVTNKPAVAFIHVPLAYVVRPSDVGRVSMRAKMPDPLAVRERGLFQTSLLRSNDVNMIDPMDVLVEHDQKARMYNLYDIHFTPAGNKVVADYSLPFIQEKVLQRERVRSANP